jgi:DNA-binding CsgD family transcriptional regulator
VAVPDLSLTEQRVVLLVAAGRGRREIAAEVGLDERTVSWHIARARQKLEQVSALQRRIDGEIKREQR